MADLRGEGRRQSATALTGTCEVHVLPGILRVRRRRNHAIEKRERDRLDRLQSASRRLASRSIDPPFIDPWQRQEGLRRDAEGGGRGRPRYPIHLHRYGSGEQIHLRRRAEVLEFFHFRAAARAAHLAFGGQFGFLQVGEDFLGPLEHRPWARRPGGPPGCRSFCRSRLRRFCAGKRSGRSIRARPR